MTEDSGRWISPMARPLVMTHQTSVPAGNGAPGMRIHMAELFNVSVRRIAHMAHAKPYNVARRTSERSEANGVLR